MFRWTPRPAPVRRNRPGQEIELKTSVLNHRFPAGGAARKFPHTIQMKRRKAEMRPRRGEAGGLQCPVKLGHRPRGVDFDLLFSVH